MLGPIRAEARRLATQVVTDQSTHLGPATVTATSPTSARVRLEDGRDVEATLALAFTYIPVEDDTLLVIGKEGRFFAIGVIEGRGCVQMNVTGDMRIHADGELSLSGGKGLRLHAPRLDLLADTMTLVAKAAVHKLDTFHQRVREMLTVHARESHTTVEETALQRGKKVVIVAEETASVNGKQILLG